MERDKALFLDRDGIINVDHGYTHKIKDFLLVPGIIPLCLKAQQRGYRLFIVTNQSGIARNMYTLDQMHVFHNHLKLILLQYRIDLEDIYYCPHHPKHNGGCFCRKPDTLMLEKAIAKYSLTPHKSMLIGDSERDVIAGNKMGCTTILVSSILQTEADFSVPDLFSAADIIL